MTAADELRALSAAATTGPWRPWGEPGSYVHIWTADERMVARDALTQDAELIVWLRNHADALADLIDAARGLLDEQREGVGQQACEYVTPCPKYHLDDTDRWCGWCRLIPALAALEADR